MKRQPGDVVALQVTWFYTHVDTQPYLGLISELLRDDMISGVQIRQDACVVTPARTVRRVTLFVTLTSRGVDDEVRFRKLLNDYDVRVVA